MHPWIAQMAPSPITQSAGELSIEPRDSARPTVPAQSANGMGTRGERSPAWPWYANRVFGLTHGELFVVGFVVVVVVSAPLWPKLGERLAELWGGSRRHRGDDAPRPAGPGDE